MIDHVVHYIEEHLNFLKTRMDFNVILDLISERTKGVEDKNKGLWYAGFMFCLWS